MSEERTLRAMSNEGQRGASEEAILDAAADEIARLKRWRGAYRSALRVTILRYRPETTDAEIEEAFREIEK